jgi:acetyl/propionyl-CoA carboxylase alpha subunit
MKRDVLANGIPGQLHLEGSRLWYDRDGARAVITDFDVQPLEPGSYWVKLGGKSFRVTLGPTGSVTVDGLPISIDIFDLRDLRAAGRSGSTQGRQEITSPMPGKVVHVLVNAGDNVEEGQGVVVVEAMKMQNEMKSPKAGTVAEIRTRPDATVSAGEVLIVIE